MSWSVSLGRSVPKAEADAAIDALNLPGASGETDHPSPDPAMLDQLRVAKLAAKVLLANVPGPYVSVFMSGHANGVGWQKKEGWANDCISITVNQMCESDLPKT